jgi:hypothetical protein
MVLHTWDDVVGEVKRGKETLASWSGALVKKDEVVIMRRNDGEGNQPIHEDTSQHLDKCKGWDRVKYHYEW